MRLHHVLTLKSTEGRRTFYAKKVPGGGEATARRIWVEMIHIRFRPSSEHLIRIRTRQARKTGSRFWSKSKKTYPNPSLNDHKWIYIIIENISAINTYKIGHNNNREI